MDWFVDSAGLGQSVGVMDYSRIRTLYDGITELKQLLRTGWVDHGVTNPESVAEHCFGVGLLAALLAEGRELELEKVLLIALVHEVCEVRTGDLTPHSGVSAAEKQRREVEAAEELLGAIDPSGRLLELWKDFEFQRTAEGRFVKQIDRLEMVFQARVYEAQGRAEKALDQFYDYTEERLADPELKAVFRDLKRESGRPVEP